MATNNQYSPYKAAKIISEQLGRTVRPQQLYGLIRNNPELQRRNELDHLVVDDKFIANYVAQRVEADAKKAAKETEAA